MGNRLGERNGAHRVEPLDQLQHVARTVGRRRLQHLHLSGQVGDRAEKLLPSTAGRPAVLVDPLPLVFEFCCLAMTEGHRLLLAGCSALCLVSYLTGRVVYYVHMFVYITSDVS